MPSVANFIRNTPAASLRTYFERAGIDIPIKIDWDGPERDIVRPLLQLVDEMDETALARVVNDAERVTKMADEAGQNALFGVVADRTTLDNLGNAHDRALWVFLNDPTGFLRAEDVRFTDERRRGRMWDGFIGEPNGVLCRDAFAVDAFETAIRKRFASNNVHVDIFDRQRPTFAGEEQSHALRQYIDSQRQAARICQGRRRWRELRGYRNHGVSRR